MIRKLWRRLFGEKEVVTVRTVRPPPVVRVGSRKPPSYHPSALDGRPVVVVGSDPYDLLNPLNPLSPISPLHPIHAAPYESPAPSVEPPTPYEAPVSSSDWSGSSDSSSYDGGSSDGGSCGGGD